MTRLRKLHVVLTSIVGAQLVVWTVTGSAFTLFDFSVVRGTNDRAPPSALSLSSVRISPDAAATAASGRAGGAAVKSETLASILGRPTYVVSFIGAKGEVLIDAETAAVTRVDRDAAARIATGAYRGHTRPRSVERRTEDDRDVFVVRLDDARDTDVTVDALTGDVTGWQNRSFRWFDALWSAHVLGYLDRKSPANWPLRIVAFLAFAAVGSGAALLIGRLRSLTSSTERTSPWLVTKLRRCDSDS